MVVDDVLMEVSENVPPDVFEVLNTLRCDREVSRDSHQSNLRIILLVGYAACFGAALRAGIVVPWRFYGVLDKS